MNPFMEKLRDFLEQIQELDTELRKIQSERGVLYANTSQHIRANAEFMDQLQFQDQIFQMEDGKYYLIQWREGGGMSIDPYTEAIHELS